MRLPLQWKVLLGYLVVAGVGMGTAGWLALDALERSDLDQLRVRLTVQARMAVRLFAGPLAAAEPDSSAMDALADQDRKSTRLNSSHIQKSRMPSSA